MWKSRCMKYCQVSRKKLPSRHQRDQETEKKESLTMRAASVRTEHPTSKPIGPWPRHVASTGLPPISVQGAPTSHPRPMGPASPYLPSDPDTPLASILSHHFPGIANPDQSESPVATEPLSPPAAPSPCSVITLLATHVSVSPRNMGIWRYRESGKAMSRASRRGKARPGKDVCPI